MTDTHGILKPVSVPATDATTNDDHTGDEAVKFPWWDREQLIVLTSWMAESGDYDADDIAAAVEKPWKYETEWRKATGQATLADLRELGEAVAD